MKSLNKEVKGQTHRSTPSAPSTTSSRRVQVPARFKEPIAEGAVGGVRVPEGKSEPLMEAEAEKTLAAVEAEMKRLSLEETDDKGKKLMTKCLDLECLIRDRIETRMVMKVEMDIMERNRRVSYDRYKTYAEQLDAMDEDLEYFKGMYYQAYDEMEKCDQAVVNKCLIPMMEKEIEKIKKGQEEFQKFERDVANLKDRAGEFYVKIICKYMDYRCKPINSPWYSGGDDDYLP